MSCTLILYAKINLYAFNLDSGLVTVQVVSVFACAVFEFYGKGFALDVVRVFYDGCFYSSSASTVITMLSIIS